jgi:hypothetical protein
MKTTGPEIITELREKLQFNVGRHLYGVLGTYQQLDQFEREDLGHATLPNGLPFPAPINLNHRLLASIEDEDLKKLIRNEARRPQAVKRTLNNTLNAVLGELLSKSNVLVLKSLELIFAYELDFSIFRTRATNQNHLLLLLPGERRSDHITLFHEASTRFQRPLSSGLFAENHLWELSDG